MTTTDIAVRDEGDLASGAKVLTLIGRAATDPTVSALSAAVGGIVIECEAVDP